ncbi:AMIN-like domain-containing (lipo)protein [Aquipuribacter sp. MA13-6]|uniref:AMIN-like domain-containing (lipo)protein n=1 Tax=unclassified Aquipuribacter TaxID=2635084 RepID=UPI003EEBEB1C
MDRPRNRRPRTRRALVPLLATLALLLPVLLAPTSAQAAPYCGIRWGSLAKSSSATVNAPAPPGHLVGVRSGRHGCYDRLVLDVDGEMYGYDVRYVSAVRQDGSGFVVPTAGGARLQVVLRAPAYDDRGRSTYTPTNPARLTDVRGYSTFRQVTWAGSFEGQTTVGLGVRARLPFRVLTLAGPGDTSRLVVDVAHRW